MSPNANLCPERLRNRLQAYVATHVPLGDFLTAILSNDLKEAVGRADDENLELIPHIVAYCYNELPSNCWGSRKRVSDWLLHNAVMKSEEEGGPMDAVDW